MKNIKVTAHGVLCMLKKLNPQKAIGPDMVATRMLKEFADTWLLFCSYYIRI